MEEKDLNITEEIIEPDLDESGQEEIIEEDKSKQRDTIQTDRINFSEFCEVEYQDFVIKLGSNVHPCNELCGLAISMFREFKSKEQQQSKSKGYIQ